MNAIAFILKEHAIIRKSFRLIHKKNQTLSNKKRLFKQLAAFLKLHESMEQKIWYVYLKKHTKLNPIIKKLISAEKSAAKAITKIKKLKMEATFEKNLLKLNKDVEQHATQEETKLFPKVNRIVDKAELNLLGKKLQAFKTKHKIR